MLEDNLLKLCWGLSRVTSVAGLGSIRGKVVLSTRRPHSLSSLDIRLGVFIFFFGKQSRLTARLSGLAASVASHPAGSNMHELSGPDSAAIGMRGGFKHHHLAIMIGGPSYAAVSKGVILLMAQLFWETLQTLESVPMMALF